MIEHDVEAPSGAEWSFTIRLEPPQEPDSWLVQVRDASCGVIAQATPTASIEGGEGEEEEVISWNLILPELNTRRAYKWGVSAIIDGNPTSFVQGRLHPRIPVAKP